MVAATCCTGVLHGLGREFRIDRQLSVFSLAQLALESMGLAFCCNEWGKGGFYRLENM